LKRRQESRQRLAADYYEAALIDVSVDTTPNVTIHDCGMLSVGLLLSKVFHWRTSKFYGKYEIWSVLRGWQNKVVGCS